MTWVDLLGYAASVVVFATFCTKTMLRLRMLAIASNTLFIAYGVLGHIFPVALLHLALLPINVGQLIALRRRIADVAGGCPIAIDGLLPFLTRAPGGRAGEVLIRKGDPADRMFYLADGTVEVVETGKRLEPGAVLGEMGLFAPHRTRTATVRCLSDCRIYEVTGSKAKELCRQDRAFGLALLELALRRMAENAARICAQEAVSGAWPGFDGEAITLTSPPSQSH